MESLQKLARLQVEARWKLGDVREDGESEVRCEKALVGSHSIRLGNGGTQGKTESKVTGVPGRLQVCEGGSYEVGGTVPMRESRVGGESGKGKPGLLGRRGPKLRE